MAAIFYERQLALTSVREAGRRPDLMVWPETAIPWRLDSAGPVLQEIAQAAEGAPVVLGALRTAEDGVRNALCQNGISDGESLLDICGAISMASHKPL